MHGFRTLFLIVGLLATFGPVCAVLGDPATVCTYYASPDGGGDGSSPSSPFRVAAFWPLARPGMTLCLLDGRYAGSESMITPPPGLGGSRALPIVVRAWNDGQVLIDGEAVRRPIFLNFNDWMLVEGMNACCSSATVVEISNSSDDVVRRVAGWDANDGNDKIFGVHYALHNLLEDVAGWGTARKIFESSFSGDFTTIRRAWGRWERSTVVGPKMVYSLAYNNYGMLLENSLGTWSGERMPPVYTLLDYSGKPYTGSGGGTYTGGQVQQPYGVFSADGFVDDRDLAHARLLGSLAYTRPTDAFAPQSLVFFTKIDGIDIRDTVGAYNPSTEGGRYTFELHTLADGSAPRHDSIANMSSFGRSGALITAGWQSSNLLSGLDPASSYKSGETAFATARGANLCFAYEDGILTSKPLWPWPMNDRIADAMLQSGRTPVDVTATVEQMFGAIPPECRSAPRVPGNPVTVPVVGRLAGWTTDLVVANPTDHATEAVLSFIPDGGAAPAARTVFLRARQSVTFADALQEVFGFDQAAGAIRLTPGPEATGAMEMHARIYALGASGTVGAGVSGPPAESLAAGRSRFVTGLSNTSDFRSTLGAANPTDAALTFRVVLRDASGAVLGQTDPVDLGAGRHTQWSLAALFPKAAGQPLSAEFRPVGASSAPLAYSMVVDNASGDPTYYSSTDSAPVVFLPAVARITGAGGTLWLTDLTMTNPGDAATDVQVSFLDRTPGSGAPPSRSVTLAPHQTLQVSDVLQAWFQRSETYGALKVTSSTQGPILAARMYTRSAGPGSVGQQVFPVRPEDFLSRGSLAGLQEDGDFRSVVGFLNAQNAGANVTALLQTQDGGLLGSTTVQLPPTSYVQQSLQGLFPAVTFAPGKTYRVVYDSGANGIGVFASTVDNASQDLTFSLATQDTAQPGPPAPPVVSFQVAPACQTCHQSMQFTDTTSNDPISWSWDFGDGATSTVQNPAHSYAASGTYVVTLTSANTSGADSVNQLLTITIPH